MKAYLDVETDRRGRLCVIGIYLENDEFVQFFGEEITAQNLMPVIERARTIVTFNGDYFDIPSIKKHLNIDLMESHASLDLFRIKKKLGIKGGLKALEKMYGIPRKTEGIDGYMAMQLWERYVHHGKVDALKLLLEYNKEDVINLVALEKVLCIEESSRKENQ